MALPTLTSMPSITQLPQHSGNKATQISPYQTQGQNKTQHIGSKPNRLVKQQFYKPIDPTIAWTSSISRHCRNGKLREAASRFIEMLLSGVEPNHITFTTLLSGCADFPSEGKSLGPLIHSYARKLRLDTCNVMVGTALVDMYAKCGYIELARLCFDELKIKNSVSWNTMLDGYMRNNEIENAIELFDKLPERDKISWTVLIDGFVKKGLFEQGLEWFREMQISNVEPDYVTIVAILSACANLGALGLGLWTHRYILNEEFRDNVRISNSLIDMYARCGCIELARQVFHKMLKRTLVSWNSIIVGLAANGFAEEALQYFELMQKQGFKPDGVSFTGALTACSHVGLVDQGLQYFDDMKRVHKLSPRVEHYGCIVDLYSRAGRLEDALCVIEKMSVKPNEIVVGSLLAACRTRGNVELAERLMDYLAALDPSVDSNFVLLANIYAAVGRWDGASKVRRKMKALGIQKNPGISSIEIGCTIHEFIAGDESHVEIEHVHEVLKILSHDLTLFGYVPEASISDLYGSD